MLGSDRYILDLKTFIDLRSRKSSGNLFQIPAPLQPKGIAQPSSCSRGGRDRIITIEKFMMPAARFCSF